MWLRMLEGSLARLGRPMFYQINPRMLSFFARPAGRPVVATVLATTFLIGAASRALAQDSTPAPATP